MHRLLALAISASVLADAATGATQPSLSLLNRHPVVLRGLGFRAGEKIRVTMTTTIAATRARIVYASTRGAFTVRFTNLSIPRCGGAYARARGNTGSVATLKIPLPACQAN